MTQCQQTPDTAERYVAGAMTDAEREAFEDHFFGCDACFGSVQALQDAAAALAAGAATGAPDAGTRRQPPYKWLAMAATLVLAVTIWNMTGSHEAPVTITTDPSPAPAALPQPAPPAVPPLAPAPAPAAAAEQPTAASRLDRWALVTPPQYVPLTTRAAQDAGDAESQPFNEAMAHYSAGRYRQAADGLGALAERSPDAAHVHFFLGISELMSNNVSRARGALQRTAESGVSPYADEAHFYLAKAAIRAGDLTTAARELQVAVERDAGPDGDAERLLGEVKKAVK
jgi:TolA-binding protein